MATFGGGTGIPLSKVSPKFLHSNSTSHTWPFSAIAELIDNAYDPDVNASELWIDIVEIDGVTCMTFADNGNGCDEDKLLKMLSFGFCEKEVYEKSNHKPIGHYGNGFKSGSMRIGQDALVFTRHFNSTSIGFLSQTYLKQSECETVMVPIVTWDLPSYKKRHSDTSSMNLDVIREFTPFKTDASMMEELKTLERLRTGTKIFLFNLKKSKMGSFELDFESDQTDIRNPETTAMDMSTVYRPVTEMTPEFRRSLREYCSILFLKPRMKIVLRGHKVKTKLISKSLSHTEIDLYRPGWLGRPLKIVFGFTCSKNASSDNYGLMMYHKNRLIKAYEKVGFQKQRNNLGEGVVGVVQVDFLQPIHNKQDFNKDEKYNAFMTSISQKLNDYWNEKKCGGSRVQVAPAGNLPDWLWAQCENCLKWRRLPDGIGNLPDRWFCHMNPDASHNRCDIEEEPEDEDEALNRPTYQKTYKKQLEEKKKMSKVEEQRKQMMKEKELREREAAIQRQLQQIKNEAAIQRQLQQTKHGEVSSTKKQMRKDVVNLEKALIESKKREQLQKQLIMQLQNQKQTTEKQKSHLLKAAENLRFVNMQSDNLLETAENLAGVSPVSSTSGNNNSKNVCIKTEDGELIAIVENEDENDGGNGKSSGKRKLPDDELIDLTLDEDEEGQSEATPSKQPRLEDIKPDKDELDQQISEGTMADFPSQGDDGMDRTVNDKTPEKGGGDTNLDKSVGDKTSDKSEDGKTSEKTVNDKSPEKSGDVQTPGNSKAEKSSKKTTGESKEQNVSEKKTESKDKTKEEKPNVKELDKQIDEARKSKAEEKKLKKLTVSNSLHTKTKEKQISARKEKDSESDSSQRYEELKKMYSSKCSDLTKAEEKLKCLQENVHKLLRIIVPDVELGDTKDIQFIVDEMIRVNTDESISNSVTNSTPST